MKKYLLILFLTFTAFVNVNAQNSQFKMGQAKGLFLGVGIGPRIPVGEFDERQTLGVGFKVRFSYSDNILMPFFLYANVGYQHFPGDQDFYKKSDYSSFSSDVITASTGVRFYFPPVLENFAILMPVIDAGISLSYYEMLHQFKVDSNKGNFTQDNTKFGFQVGGGISMFLLDVMAHYNYYHDNQFVSVNLVINIPIYIKM